MSKVKTPASAGVSALGSSVVGGAGVSSAAGAAGVGSAAAAGVDSAAAAAGAACELLWKSTVKVRHLSLSLSNLVLQGFACYYTLQWLDVHKILESSGNRHLQMSCKEKFQCNYLLSELIKKSVFLSYVSHSSSL